MPKSRATGVVSRDTTVGQSDPNEATATAAEVTRCESMAGGREDQ
jgi:hypothetical protein